MKPAREDLRNRHPAWEALADLYLDTDVSLSRQWRAETLAGLPYTVEELEQILIGEVYPVCRRNPFSIAGEWAGFDPVWQEQKILRRLESHAGHRNAINLGRLTVPLSAEWRATKAGIAACHVEHALASGLDAGSEGMRR